MHCHCFSFCHCVWLPLFEICGRRAQPCLIATHIAIATAVAGVVATAASDAGTVVTSAAEHIAVAATAVNTFVLRLVN